MYSKKNDSDVAATGNGLEIALQRSENYCTRRSFAKYDGPKLARDEGNTT